MSVLQKHEPVAGLHLGFNLNFFVKKEDCRERALCPTTPLKRHKPHDFDGDSRNWNKFHMFTSSVLKKFKQADRMFFMVSKKICFRV